MKKLLIFILTLVILALIAYFVYNYIDASSFNIIDDTVVISTQESYQIDVYDSKGEYNDPTLYEYITSDDKVAFVDENGRIISVAKGDCDITVKRGYKSFTIKVTVYEKESSETPTQESNSNSSSNSNSNSNSNTNVAVTGIKLDNSSATIKVGETVTINYSVTPDNATNKKVTFSTEDNDIISINNGVVTGKKVGTATVLIKTADGGRTATFKVTVAKDTVNVTGVSATISSSNITVGKTAKITTKISPNNASNKGVSYKSNNTAVATVDSSGTVKGISAGTAVITVTSNDGHKTATVKVTVTNPVHATSVSISGPSEVVVGQKITLTFSVTPSNAVEKTATWSVVAASGSSGAATISQNGVLTGTKTGTVIVYATLANGAKSGKTITVKAKVPTFRIFLSPIKNASGEIQRWNFTVSKDGVTSTDYVYVTCGSKTARPAQGYFPANVEHVSTCTFAYSDGSSNQTTQGYAVWSE